MTRALLLLQILTPLQKAQMVLGCHPWKVNPVQVARLLVGAPLRQSSAPESVDQGHLLPGE